MKKICIVVHGDSDSNYEKAISKGLSEEAAKEFSYALYETEIEFEVDEKTGKYKAVTFEGRKIV
jgi:hypothetical protein